MAENNSLNDNRTTQVTLDQLNSNCDEASRSLRNRINWHQTSVFQKAKTGKYKLFKLAIQLSKIVFVTLQALIFLNTFGDISLHEKKTIETSISFLFELEQYDTQKKIFTKRELANSILLAFDNHLTLESNPLTNLKFDGNKSFILCFKLTKLDLFEQQNLSSGYKYGQNCFNIKQKKEINEHINQTIFSPLYPLLSNIEYQIEFNSEKIFSSKIMYQKRCSRYLIKVTLENNQRNGIINPYVWSNVQRLPCMNEIMTARLIYRNICVVIFNVLFIFASITSTFLCLRSLVSNIKLCAACSKYFTNKRNYKLKFYEKIDIFNSWLIVIIFTDILSLISSVLFLSQLFACPTFGISCTRFIISINILLVWVGILRYISYFPSYSFFMVLIKNNAAFSTKFCMLVILVFVPFALCAYCTIGPYHQKFSSFLKVTSSLFALMNGDEVFITYQSMSLDSNTMLAFSKIFLSLFIFLFMYGVISIFVAILNNYNNSDIGRGIITRFLEECDCSFCTIHHHRHPDLTISG